MLAARVAEALGGCYRALKSSRTSARGRAAPYVTWLEAEHRNSGTSPIDAWPEQAWQRCGTTWVENQIDHRSDDQSRETGIIESLRILHYGKADKLGSSPARCKLVTPFRAALVTPSQICGRPRSAGVLNTSCASPQTVEVCFTRKLLSQSAWSAPLQLGCWGAAEPQDIRVISPSAV